MASDKKSGDLQNLPGCAVEFIRLVIKKMRYRKKVRLDVQRELAAHFEDGLEKCATDKEKDKKAQQLISEFGDAKLLGVLLCRAKKRCRPVWRTVVARTFQTIGVLILLFILYTGWFLTGKPTINVDYLALVNQMGRPQLRDEDNAWPHYEKAITLFVKTDDELSKIIGASSRRPGFGGLADEEQQKIREWVKLNEAAWQEFVAASSKAYCYREYRYDPNIREQDKWLFNMLVPHLSDIRSLARLGSWRARMQIDANQPQQAVEDCLAIAHCGSQWQGKGTLVEQLVGIAISGLAYGEILNIVEAKNLSSADLKYLQQQLLQIYPQSFPLMNMEGERLCFMDVIQHFFTEGGLGGGHLLPHKLYYLDGITGSDYEEESVVRLPFYTAAAMAHAGRDKTIDKGNEIYDQIEKRSKMSPYERHITSSVCCGSRSVENMSIDQMIMKLSKYRYFLIRSIIPAVDRASDIAYRIRAHHQATVTVLALQRWRLEKNEYPANLNELVAAGYLKELPMDPYTDKPLIYKKTDDNFTVYSIGPNFMDDGGQPGKDDKGKIKKFADNGDWVFWPVMEFETKRQQ